VKEKPNARPTTAVVITLTMTPWLHSLHQCAVTWAICLSIKPVTQHIHTLTRPLMTAKDYSGLTTASCQPISANQRANQCQRYKEKQNIESNRRLAAAAPLTLIHTTLLLLLGSISIHCQYRPVDRGRGRSLVFTLYSSSSA